MPTVEHIDAIERLSPKTRTDLGANRGQFSLMAQYLFPEIAIHAFEALEGERVRCRSVLSEPLKIYSMALSATAGDVRFLSRHARIPHRFCTQALLNQLWLILGDGVNQAADLASGATSIPSWNLAP